MPLAPSAPVFNLCAWLGSLTGTAFCSPWPFTAAICEDLFAEDFSRLGFAHRPFTAPRPTVLDAQATAALAMIDERNKRIEDLVAAIGRVEEGEEL